MPPAEPALAIDDNANGHKRKTRKTKDRQDSDDADDPGDRSETTKPKKRKKRAREEDDTAGNGIEATVPHDILANVVENDDGAPISTKPKKKKNKKRDRELDGADGGDDTAQKASDRDDEGAEQPRKKRRKKKDRNSQPHDEAGERDNVVAESAPSTAVSVPSNEEILRMLQSVDISKVDINAVLKSMQAASTVPVLAPSELHATSPPVQRKTRQQPARPSKSASHDTAASTSSPSPSAAPSRAMSRPPPSGSLPLLRNENTAEHAHMIATKWMSSAQLQKLVDTEGLIIKKGKFSTIEEHAIKSTIEKYSTEHGLTDSDVVELIFSKAKRTESSDGFWAEVALSVPQRGLLAVYHYVRRAFHPLKKQGKWTADEDALLLKAVGDVGQAWERVSEHVGRASGDCRDRYRNHLAHRNVSTTGKWSAEEEAELVRIVREMTIDKGKSADADVFWVEVSKKMGNRRTRQQCRIKWTDGLNRVVKSNGANPRWTSRDALILVHRVAALTVLDDSEINWNLINNEEWNLWSAHQLQRRWLALKRSVRGFEQMSFTDLLEILKNKMNVPDDADDIPPAPDNDESSSRRRPRKDGPTSVPIIEDEDILESEEQDD